MALYGKVLYAVMADKIDSYQGARHLQHQQMKPMEEGEK